MPTIDKPRPPGVADNWIDPACKFDSDLERQFALLWAEHYPKIDLHSQVYFAKGRKLHFDFAHWPSKTAIEIQGGIWIQGGHSTPKGIQQDYEKLNLAQSLGWLVFQVTAESMNGLDVLGQIAGAIEARGCHLVESGVI